MLALFGITMLIVVRVPPLADCSSKIVNGRIEISSHPVAQGLATRIERQVFLDLSDGTIERQVAIVPRHGTGNFLIREPSSHFRGTFDTPKTFILQEQTDSGVLRTFFEFPGPFPNLFSSHYVFGLAPEGQTNQKLYVLDLATKRLTAIEVAGDHGGFWKVGPDSFYRLIDKSRNASSQAFSYQLQLFTVSDQGVPVLLNKWNVGASSKEGSATRIGERIYSVAPDQQHLQVHSTIDGQWLSNMKLPREAIENIQHGGEVFLTDNLLQTEMPNRAREYWSLPELLPWKMPNSYRPALLGDTRQPQLFIDWGNLGVIRAYDKASQHQVWQYDLNLGGRWCFGHDSRTPTNEFVVVRPYHGITIDKIDLRTGKLVRRFTPYRWISYALPTVLVGFAVWTPLWIRYWHASGLPFLVNVVGLAAIGLAIPLTYVVWWQQFRAVIIHDYCQGLVGGLLVASCAWLVFGNTRFGTRYIPLWITICVLVLTERVAFRGTHLGSLVMTIISCAILLLGLLACRVVGLKQPAKTLLEHDMQEPPNRRADLTIRDMFVASACIAFLLAITLPTARGLELSTFLAQPPSLAVVKGMTAIAILLVGCVLLTWFMLSRYRGLSWLAAGLVSLIVGGMVVEACYSFTTGESLMLPRDKLDMRLFRMVAAAFTTYYVCLLCFQDTYHRK